MSSGFGAEGATVMDYRNLGRSGLQVSAAGLGCNNFGRRCDQQQTNAVVGKALELGVTLFDTADIYGPRGLSEEYLGKALAGHRREAVIATKFAGPMGEGPLWGGASRRYIFEAVEASLRRLGTDFIDLYQIHFPDARTPIEETLGALDDIVQQGKVRYIGCSNFASWQVADAVWVSKTNHLASFVSAQNQYNLLDRRIERELVPACKAFGLGILPYFPLASGFLTGKYKQGQPAPEGTRLAAAAPQAQQLLTDANYATLGKLEAFAEARDHTMVDLAIGWLASQPHVGSVISGATKPEQVEQNARATEWKLNAEELAEIDRIARR
jgi:aryl-alcohol dehydrogenase-like predicted oxidoreductase